TWGFGCFYISACGRNRNDAADRACISTVRHWRRFHDSGRVIQRPGEYSILGSDALIRSVRQADPHAVTVNARWLAAGFEQTATPRRSIALRTRNRRDRKSTRLNSSHVAISYAV